jgi:small subunit ribosomal protein S16
VGAQPTEPVLKLLKITGDWQKFKGLPGAEGRLKVKPPKPSKLELFNAALAEAEGAPTTEATSPKKKKAPAKAPAKKAAEKAEKPESAEAAAPEAAPEAVPAAAPKAAQEAAEALEAPAESEQQSEG